MGSKYEKAFETKQRNERFIKKLELQIPTADRDKTGLKDWRTSGYNGKELSFTTSVYHGYYGNSSVTSDASMDLGREIAKTLCDLRQEIVNRTISRLQKEIKEAANEAKEEAKQILEQAEQEE